MLQSVKLAIDLSNSRERLGELAGMAEMSEEQRSEMSGLEKAHVELEGRYRAALISEGEKVDQARAADPGFNALETRAHRDGGWVNAAKSGKSLDGAAGEYTEELMGSHRDSDGNVLVPFATADMLEQRADTVAAGLAGPQNKGPIMPTIWRQRALGRLGITPMMVPPGEYSPRYVKTTSRPATASAAESATRPTAGKFEITESDMTATKLIEAVDVTVESYARIPRAQLDARIRAEMTASMMDQAEAQVVAGDGKTSNVKGILTALAPTEGTTALTYDAIADLVSGDAVIDGVYAQSEADVRLMIGPTTRAKFIGTRISNRPESAYDALVARGAQVVTSAFIPAATSSTSNKAQSYIVRRGMARGDYTWAQWAGFSLIADMYTQAGVKILFTATSLFNFRVETTDRKGITTGSLKVLA